MNFPSNLGKGIISGGYVTYFDLDDKAQIQALILWHSKPLGILEMELQLQRLADESSAREIRGQENRPHVWRVCLAIDYHQKASRP